MPLQIRCTCQQILAVDDAHQGQVVGCPYCGAQLAIPILQQQQPGSPQQPAPNDSPQNPAPQPGWQNPFPPLDPEPASNAPRMPFLDMDVPARSRSNLNELAQDSPNVASGWAEADTANEVKIWHIPCPKGHILDTPDDMLDQDVLCPYCETQFTLRKMKSVEETEKRDQARAIREERRGQLWLNWAIGIAAVVILGIIVMIALVASK